MTGIAEAGPLKGLSLSRDHAVTLLTAALLAVAIVAGVALGFSTAGPVVPFDLPIVALVVLYAAAEACFIHLAIRRETHTFSLTEIPLIIGAFLAMPGDVLVAQAIGAGLVLTLVRRQPARKVVFNLASFALSTGFALMAFHVLVDPADPLGPRGWLAAFVAALIADTLSSLCVETVIHVTTGESSGWVRRLLAGIPFTLGNATLGMATVIVLIDAPAVIWVQAVMGVALYVSYRSTVHERQHRERVLGLEASTHAMQRSVGTAQLERTILTLARDLFGASVAELVVPVTPGGPFRYLRLGPDLSLHEQVRDAPQRPSRWREVLDTDRGVRLLLDRDEPDERLRPDAGTRSVLAAPVHLEPDLGGILAVMDREARVGGWRADELPAFETLANHAAATLRSDRLIDDIAARAAENEHLARHDSLTGLPNREWLCSMIDDALRTRVGQGLVLAVDLLDFRELSETLGPDISDGVLRAVGQRLESHARPGDIVGRLDAHEFAILTFPLDHAGADADADAAGQTTAQRIVETLEEAFVVGDLRLGVVATVGFAPVADAQLGARTLLRQADRAVVMARASGSQVARYEPEQDSHNPARLALVADLRRAIDQRELTVHFQPVVRVNDRQVVAAEALVRWRHPTRGLLLPDSFVGIAEQTDVLRPMTLFVLETALAQCARWRSAGHRLGVAVNLSARNLLDQRLTDDVSRAIRHSGLPSAALTLEVTETTVVSDSARARATLASLRSLGVGLAIDDFGQGYASLAYLRQLPATELKIDRAFVRNLEDSEADRLIVSSTTALAHDLGLRVVAEGVESDAILEMLGELGCDRAQGYGLGRPIDPEAFAQELGIGVAVPASQGR